MRLFLIRHGQTPSNVLGLLDTEPPGPGLTELGVEQAAGIPGQLAGAPIVAVFSSNATRAQETAAPLAAERGLSINVRPGLREIAAGDWEMAGDDESVRGYLTLIGSWMAGRLGERSPGVTGESGHDVLARVDEVISELDAYASDPDSVRADSVGTDYVGADSPGAVAAFAHGAVIRLWASIRAKNLDNEFGARGPLHNCGIVELDGSPGDGWEVLSWTGTPVTNGRAVSAVATESAAASDVGAHGPAADEDPFDEPIPVPD